MNLPEILGQTGARSAPKPSDDGITPPDEENADAFMASVVSAGGEASGKSSDGAEVAQENGAQHQDDSGQIGANFETVDGDSHTGTVADHAASDALGQALFGNGGEVTEEPQQTDAADPVPSETQTVPSANPTSSQEVVAAPLAGSLTTTPASEATPDTGKSEGASTTDVDLSKIQSGAPNRSAQTEAGTSLNREAVSTNATGQPATRQSQETPIGIPKAVEVARDHAPRQTTPQAPNDTKPRETSATSAQLGLHQPEMESEAQLADDAAEQQLHDRGKDSEPVPKVVNREDPGVRTTGLRSAGAPAPALAQMATSSIDGTIAGSAPASPAPGNQTPAARAAPKEAMAALGRDGSGGPGKTTIQQITAALRHQPLLQKIDLTLDPPELGRVEIQFEVAESGMRATLAAERATTGEIIRRQADVLLQQLDDAGFDDVSLDFRDFEGDGQGGSSFDPDPDPSVPNKLGDVVADRPASAIRRPIADTGMDIRL